MVEQKSKRINFQLSFFLYASNNSKFRFIVKTQILRLLKKLRDEGEKDNGYFIGLVPYKTLLLCVKFEFHGWYLKWKEGIWISEKKKKNPWMMVKVYIGLN